MSGSGIPESENSGSTGADAGANADAPVGYSKTPGDKLRPEARELFERYSGIPAEDVERHVCDVVSFIHTSLNALFICCLVLCRVR